MKLKAKSEKKLKKCKKLKYLDGLVSKMVSTIFVAGHFFYMLTLQSILYKVKTFNAEVYT